MSIRFTRCLYTIVAIKTGLVSNIGVIKYGCPATGGMTNVTYRCGRYMIHTFASRYYAIMAIITYTNYLIVIDCDYRSPASGVVASLAHI